MIRTDSPEDLAAVNNLMNSLVAGIAEIIGTETTTAILRSAARLALSDCPLLCELPISLGAVDVVSFVYSWLPKSDAENQIRLLMMSLLSFTRHLYDMLRTLTGSILVKALEPQFAALLQALHSD